MFTVGRLVPVYPPPSFDTMDNVAFMGIITDENDNQVATFGPKICTFKFDSDLITLWDHPHNTALWMTELDYTWKTDYLRNEFIGTDVN